LCTALPNICACREPQDLIQVTVGAELCATQVAPTPNASDCVFAYDDTYLGRVDLSRAVTIGEPIKKSSLLWSVPYDVKDAAGNAAATVWRDILVEEVDLLSVERKIREEILQEKNVEIQKAVDKALLEDRKTRERKPTSSRTSKTSAVCPACPSCDPSKVDESSCQAICVARIKECALEEQSLVVQFLVWLERLFPPPMVPLVLTCTAIMVSFLSLRWLLTLIFNPQPYRRGYYDDADRERALIQAVAYHSSATGRDHNSSLVPPPSESGILNGHFSPQASYQVAPTASSTAVQNHSQGNDFSDIYHSPIITPSKRGDGVRRRTSHSANKRTSY
jgi:hypothetical protein